MEATLNNECNNHNVKLTLSYDGTTYFGFQSQIHKNTIEDQLRHAIGTILKLTDEDVKLTTAGRTDTGVHAFGQVVNFFTTNISMKENNWILALNSLLPDDIRIGECEFVDDKFNARRSALYREYNYNLDNNKYINALNGRFATHVYKKDLDINKLNEYCKYLVGEHDFTSFCAAGDTNKTKSRCIYKAEFTKQDNNRFVFDVIGNAFLQHQIRIMIGTIITLYNDDIAPIEIKNILEAKNRENAGPTFSSKGLVFKKVYYIDEFGYRKKINNDKKN